MAFASGMAASDAVLRRLGPDDHVLMPHQGYGGTWKLVSRVLSVAYDAVDQSDLDAVAAAWRPETRLVWVETPTNPTLGIVDIEALARLAHERGALCVVDNTLATPYLQRPLELGADVVVHSTTKYLGGHSDVIGGFVACDDDDLAAAITLVQHAAGAVPGPMDCFLVLRGVKTLAVRMERHCRNAAAVAEALAAHPAVKEVRWPGLAAHPGHDLARRQMRGFGGMVAFTLAGGEAAARAVAGSLRLFTLGESLGGRRVAGGLPHAHEPRRGGGHGPGRRSGPAAPVGGHRGRRRPGGRPHPGARRPGLRPGGRSGWLVGGVDVFGGDGVDVDVDIVDHADGRDVGIGDGHPVRRRSTAATATTTLTPAGLVAHRALGVGDERHFAGRLDGHGHVALVLDARAGGAAGLDLGPVADEPAEEVDVLVVHEDDVVAAEDANLGLAAPVEVADRRPLLAAIAVVVPCHWQPV